MSKKLFLYLVLVSALIFSGCFIKGKVVDENGAGVSDITVTLSGDQSRVTNTNCNGYYMFGDLNERDIIPAGSYTVTPSKPGYHFIPASKNVIINNVIHKVKITEDLCLSDIVPWPAADANFLMFETKAGSLKVTILLEELNSNVFEGLIPGHGLTIHIEMDQTNILIDPGFGSFINNAEKLGIDIKEVDIVVISNTRISHNCGLKAFFEINEKAKVYIREEAREGCYLMMGSNPVYIGINKDTLKEYEHRFHFVSEYIKIIDDVFIITKFELKYPTPNKGDLEVLVKDGEEFIPDTFEHEQLLVLKFRDELIIFSGCSHHGILNMVDAAVQKFPGASVKAVFGGFHLTNLGTGMMLGTPEEIRNIAHKLLEYSIENIYTGHSSGLEAYQLLKEVIGENIGYCGTGSIVIFDPSGSEETLPPAIEMPPMPSPL